MVHGDDFVTAGEREETRWLKEKLEARFEIKSKVVGLGVRKRKQGGNGA